MVLKVPWGNNTLCQTSWRDIGRSNISYLVIDNHNLRMQGSTPVLARFKISLVARPVSSTTSVVLMYFLIAIGYSLFHWFYHLLGRVFNPLQAFQMWIIGVVDDGTIHDFSDDGIHHA